jgi:P27 family predicted phage terminase small subunit
MEVIKVAQKGRKPKPTAIKKLEGNPGKRKLNQNEPKPEKKAPKCPEWLEEEAKNEWSRLEKPLENLGILTEIDRVAFAGYCESFARWKQAEEFISKHGMIIKTPSGYFQQVPQVSISQTYLKLLLKFATEFGMTPSSRSRLIADNGSGDVDDPMELILFEGGKK